MIADNQEAGTVNARTRPSRWTFLIALPWWLGIIMEIYSCDVDRAVAGRQKSQVGTITAHEPRNHNRYGYKFYVDGKAYIGWEIPQQNDYVIGQQVMVCYDPLDPSRNALTDFDELSLRSAGPVPLLLIGIGTVVFVVSMARRRNQVRATSKPRRGETD